MISKINKYCKMIIVNKLFIMSVWETNNIKNMIVNNNKTNNKQW